MSFHFVLKRSGWGYDDLYEALKTGEKTSEWRDGSPHWISRLLNEVGRKQLQWAHELKARNKELIKQGRMKPYFLLPFPDSQWKHTKARFVVGYTKRPMLLADVKAIMYNSKTNQFEIQIENVVELPRGM